jgi:phosphatidylglycerophosphatase GEP4
MNISALYLGLSCIFRPSKLRPSLILQDFAQLPQDIAAELSQASRHRGRDETVKVDIRALVLDKDNCFATPYSLNVHDAYRDRFGMLKRQFPGAKLLVVSNTVGCLPSKHNGMDESGAYVRLRENLDGPHVLVHKARKPGCGNEVMAYLKEHAGVVEPSQVCVIGDRLFTDVLMANLMGAHSIWIRRGVVEDHGAFTRFERLVFRFIN